MDIPPYQILIGYTRNHEALESVKVFARSVKEPKTENKSSFLIPNTKKYSYLCLAEWKGLLVRTAKPTINPIKHFVFNLIQTKR